VNGRISKRVFIVGCPRSGTTLLQSMLASHPDVLSFPETHILQLGIEHTGRAQIIIAPFVRVKALNSFFLELFGRRVVHNVKDAIKIFMSARYFVEFMILMLDKVCLENGCKVWVDKTPEHLFYISLIQDVAPEAKFIHMVRDGGPVVASIVEMWDQYMFDWSSWRRSLTFLSDLYHVIRCYAKYVNGFNIILLWKMIRYRRYIRASELWNDSFLETKKFNEQGNHYICFYEDLTLNPSDELQKIVAFLDIQFLPAMLHPEKSAPGLIRQNEIWKNDNLAGIRQASTKKYDSLPQEIRELLEVVLVASGKERDVIRKEEANL